ncbi:hypothetical protein RLDS_12430 [Sphingobium lactosutens DS20]|uniref:Tryptophan synthase beta chain-like PALP domain-containing protein n=2 Tax=Sphingobium TaxID=165695 RepID=T0HF39_9SPHN|nr:hypothetical protein RLDS_12430 [Sphingobium lactosutens DS20]
MVANPLAVYDEARRLAAATGGHYLDQFSNAERATDWRGNNISESIFQQMREEELPVPAWIVCGAGNGGTSATIGRYIRYCRHGTRVCVADPEGFRSAVGANDRWLLFPRRTALAHNYDVIRVTDLREIRPCRGRSKVFRPPQKDRAHISKTCLMGRGSLSRAAERPGM